MGPVRRACPVPELVGPFAYTVLLDSAITNGVVASAHRGDQDQIDRIWDAVWSGGMSNPLEVVEQITYLLFIKRLDDEQARALERAQLLGKPIESNPFPVGRDELRWSFIKNMHPDEAYDAVANQVFPYIREMGGDDSTFAEHMKDARLTIPSPGLLAKVIDMLDEVPMDDLDTKGDVYEYLLSEISTSGKNGQFRTPRHIIKMIVEMMAPKPGDTIVDPAAARAGSSWRRSNTCGPTTPTRSPGGKWRSHFHNKMFTGFDFDRTMLRIGSMNMLLHGVEQPDVRYRDSLAEANTADAENYSMVLANPPFADSSRTRISQRTCSASSRPRRPNCSSWRCSCGC